MRTWVRFVFFYILMISQSFGQRAILEEYISLNNLGINEGLSQGLILSILQDRSGFIWFATKDGLNRYDGYSFKVYRHDPEDSTTISDNHIFQLLEDSKGRLWVFTNNSELDLFIPETETFEHYKPKNGLFDQLSPGENSRLLEDAYGDLWFRTLPYWFKIHIAERPKQNSNPFRAKGNRYILSFENQMPVFKNKLSIPDFAGEIKFDSKGNQWMWTLDSIYLLSKSAQRFEDKVRRYALNERVGFDTSGFEPKDFFIEYNLIEDRLQNQMYLVSSYGISVYNEDLSKLVEGFPYPDHLKRRVWNLAFDGNHKLWINARKATLRFDPKICAYNQVYEIQKESSGKPLKALQFYADRSDLLWIGTSNATGVKIFNPRAELFNHKYLPGGYSSVKEIYELPDKRIVISTGYSGNVFILDKETSEIKPLFDVANSPFSKYVYDGFSFVSKDGKIVLQYADHNLGIYDIRTGSLTKQQIPLHNPSASFVFCSPEDEGKIWAFYEDSSRLGSLVKYDYQTGKVLDIFKIPFKIEHKYYQFISASYKDKSGIYWFATVMGLLRFSEKENTFRLYRSNVKDTSSLPVNMIFSLCADPKEPERFLWVGTNGGGLAKFEFSTGTFTRFNQKKHGLPNDVIYGILSDENQSLWLSTNSGLANFNLNTMSVQIFTSKDGLQSNEFNRYAYFKGSDGTLFFGGVNGLNYFKPEQVFRKYRSPHVVITDIKIYNRSINEIRDANISPVVAQQTRIMYLKHTQNMISFSFSALDFTDPVNNKFKYILEGADLDWISNSKLHEVSYTNLSPGTYTFKVKGSNHKDSWSENAAEVKIIIAPPIYKTWYFLIVAFGLFSALTWTIIRYYSQRKLKEQLLELERQREVENIRMRISRDIHDDIGSGLTRISLLSELLKTASGTNPEFMKSQIDKIISSSHQMIGDLGEIVWSTNPIHDNLNSLLGFLRNYMEELMDDVQQEYQIDFPVLEESVELHPDLKRNLFLALKEGINNAVKYAKANCIRLRCTLQGNTYQFVLEDDGIGFDTQNTREFGNGIRNIKKRIELCHGTAEVHSSPGKGTTWIITGNLYGK